MEWIHPTNKLSHTYIEVSLNNKVYRWYIEAENIPADLTDFVKAVRDAMSKLNWVRLAFNVTIYQLS